MRRRTIVLRVDEYGLTVQAPWRTPQPRIERFLQGSARWILRKIDEWSRFAPRVQHWQSGGTVPFLGRTLRLELSRDPVATTVQLADPDCLRVRLADPACEQSARLAVLDWYRRHARMNFEARLAFYAQHLRLAAPRFFLSGARSRWGSCNASGRIGLNWRLIQAPQFVIDYVVVHELAHLREMNHSRRFWSIVAEAFPRHAEARAHLDARGRWYLAI